MCVGVDKSWSDSLTPGIDLFFTRAEILSNSANLPSLNTHIGLKSRAPRSIDHQSVTNHQIKGHGLVPPFLSKGSLRLDGG
jgi:hypothetical protein